MRIVGRIVKWLGLLVLAAVVGLAGWLFLAPPDLIRVGSGYSAKIVCSNVFIAGRDPQAVLALDVQAPGHPLLRLMSVDVDYDEGVVTAGLLGMFGRSVAIHREGLGCASVPDGNIAAARAAVPPLGEWADPVTFPSELWPDGETVEPSRDPAIRDILDDAALTGPGMRAVVVVHEGRVIGERYGEGFSAETPLLGWSMTKTVNAALIGLLAQPMEVEGAALRADWTDGRAEVTLGELMAMSSGLEFNEDYGDVTDVTRMLFLEPDMAAFASAKPLAAAHGSAFNYSSGTSVVLSRLWQDAFDEPEGAYAWPREALFDPLGMSSAVLEADAAGTYVGSSYLYATARDWARFGQFLLQDGEWEGRQLLPEGYVAWMREAAPVSDGAYGRGQLWLAAPGRGAPAELPADMFWLRGHDGQSVAIVPSRNLVVVRLGLTPSNRDYSPAAMIAALAAAVE